MADPEGGDVVSINEQYRWGWGRFKALLSRHHRFTLLGSDVLTAKAICRKVRQAFSVHVSVERVKVRTTGGPANFLQSVSKFPGESPGKLGSSWRPNVNFFAPSSSFFSFPLFSLFFFPAGKFPLRGNLKIFEFYRMASSAVGLFSMQPAADLCCAALLPKCGHNSSAAV